MNIFFVLLTLALIATVFLVPIGIVVLIVKILKGGESGKGKQTSAEEARLVQEIHHGLTRMESRIEVLETLLVDAEKEKEKKS